MANVNIIEIYDKKEMEKISQWVRLRNIIAHQYLDIRWASIKKFIQETEPLDKNLLAKIKEYLRKSSAEDI